MTCPTQQAKTKFTPPSWTSTTIALLLGCATPVGRAAIFQSDHWALSGEAEAGVGYDSNLFARNGSDGDGYALLEPTFSLQRLNSLTNLKADISVASYTYFTRTDLDSLDPKLTLRVRYPFDEEVEATQELTANASRLTQADANIGTRLRSDNYSVHWEGSFNPTGKLTLLTRTDLRRTDYLTPGYNTNDAATAGLTVDFVSNERLQLGAGYDYEYSRSRPDDSSLPQTQSRQNRYTLSGRGEFLPKVTGNFFLGAGYTVFSGGFTQTEWDFVAGASLVWQATERAQIACKIDRSIDFAPGGAALTHSSLDFEWTQELAGGFTAILGAGAGEVLYHFGTDYQHFHEYGGRFQLSYALTERLTATLTTSYTKQNSDEFFANYTRGMVYASLITKF
jgi:hypothetical protein